MIKKDFGKDYLCGAYANAVDLHQVEASETPQFGTHRLVAATFDGLFLKRIRMRRGRSLFALVGLQSRHGLQQARLVRGNQLFDGVEELEGRCEIEQMFFSPRPGEIARDVLDGFTAAMVAKRAQLHRIALSRDDGADDGHARRPGQIGDGSMDLDVHLVERLLHPLDTAGPLFDEICQLSMDGPHRDDRGTWAEGGSQQTAAVQKLNPLAVVEIGFAPGHVVQLVGIDGYGLDASRL